MLFVVISVPITSDQYYTNSVGGIWGVDYRNYYLQFNSCYIAGVRGGWGVGGDCAQSRKYCALSLFML